MSSYTDWSPIEGPHKGSLQNFLDAVHTAVADVQQRGKSTTDVGEQHPAITVMSSVLSRFAPPYCTTLTARSAITGEEHTFPNPIPKDSTTALSSLALAIEAFEAEGRSEGAGPTTDEEEEGGGSDVCYRILPFVAFAASQYYDLFREGAPAPFARSTDLTRHLCELTPLMPHDDPRRVVVLSKAQALCIVACSFWCLFPRLSHQWAAVVPCMVSASEDEVSDADADVNADDKAPTGSGAVSGSPKAKAEVPSVSVGSLPTINCDDLFEGGSGTVEAVKLHMMLLYFSEMERRYKKLFGFGVGPPGAIPIFPADNDGPSLFFIRNSLPKGEYFFDDPDATSSSDQTPVSNEDEDNVAPKQPEHTPPTERAPNKGGRLAAQGLIALPPFVLANLKESIDDQHDVLRVDFANKVIGGGAMGGGCVQEEITFALCPELIATRLMNADMGAREAIIMVGAEQFALLKEGTYGYGMSCEGPPSQPEEMFALSCSSAIVAVDALDYRGRGARAAQYGIKSIRREMVKLAAGLAAGDVVERCAEALAKNKAKLLGESYLRALSSGSGITGNKSIVATGNWGCGVFLGDVEMKSLLQWLVCSVCGKTMHYFPFDNARMALLGSHLMPQLCARGTTTAELFEFFRVLVKSARRKSRNASGRGAEKKASAGLSVFELLADHFGLTVPSEGVNGSNDTTDTEADA